MSDQIPGAGARPSDAPGATFEPPAPPLASDRSVREAPPSVLVAEPEPEIMTPPIDLGDPALYLNRELSLLDFQERVLEEAEDPSNPLLERVKFLSIFSSNMAEFYMVRVAGLKQQVSAGVRDLSADGLTPAEQLQLVRERSASLLNRSRRAYSGLREELCRAGIYLLDYSALDEAQKRFADEYFETNILGAKNTW